MAAGANLVTVAIRGQRGVVLLCEWTQPQRVGQRRPTVRATAAQEAEPGARDRAIGSALESLWRAVPGLHAAAFFATRC